MKRIERDKTTVLDVLGALEKGESVFGVVNRPLRDSGKFIKITKIVADEDEGGGGARKPALPRQMCDSVFPGSLFLSTKVFTVEEWTLSGMGGRPYCKVFKTPIRGFGFDENYHHATTYDKDFYELRVSALQGKLLYFPDVFYREELRSWCSRWIDSEFARNYYKIYPEFAKVDCTFTRSRGSRGFRDSYSRAYDDDSSVSKSDWMRRVVDLVEPRLPWDGIGEWEAAGEIGKISDFTKDDESDDDREYGSFSF